jgi:hypothetical protein
MSLNDPRRQRPIAIKWVCGGKIGRLMIDREFWGAVEWSPKRNAWCVEDAEGRGLTHEAHIHGQGAAKPNAIALAQTMIRDGRLPSPEEARRQRDQVTTTAVAIPAIMERVTFALGVADARAGRGSHPDFDLWKTNDQWSYERGRAWAVLTPRHIKLKRNGRIRVEAITWFARHADDIL